MLLFSSALRMHKLTFIKLSQCPEYIPLAAKWAEGEWGYIRNKGIEFREELMRSIADDVYIGTFAGQLVAMFSLANYAYHEDLVEGSAYLPKTCELSYVYVDKDFRGLGFGKQIVEQAKRIAIQNGFRLILLDTLKPDLNSFYEKHGAEVVSESHLFSHPTDMLRINI